MTRSLRPFMEGSEILGRDYRQLINMERQIDAYRRNQMSLPELVEDLIFLRDLLDVLDESADQAFTSAVADLESVASCSAIHRQVGKEAMLEEVADGALAALETLIQGMCRR